MEDTKPLATENRVETLYTALFGKSERQYSNERSKIDKITDENAFQHKSFSLNFDRRNEAYSCGWQRRMSLNVEKS